MRITYIKHSGFVVEWDRCIWIFDYWKGTIPETLHGKKVIVFGSHSHQDHFNPGISVLLEQCPNVEYLLSDDIHFQNDQKITLVKAHQTYHIDDGAGNAIVVKTLASTDCGVAFVVWYQGKVVYHAGDLNWWVWKGESEQEYQSMTAAFQEEIRYLKEIAPAVDVAFIPVDPRQEEWYFKGITYTMEQIDVKTVFPMHVWNQYRIIEQLKSSPEAGSYRERIIPITGAGQSFELGER